MNRSAIIIISIAFGALVLVALKRRANVANTGDISSNVKLGADGAELAGILDSLSSLANWNSGGGANANWFYYHSASPGAPAFTQDLSTVQGNTIPLPDGGFLLRKTP